MTEKIILTNVRQRFANAREMCPGMSDTMYELTDYISQVFNNELDVYGLTTSIYLVYMGLKCERDLFTGKTLPENIINDSEDIIKEIKMIPQVIDEIADKEFAESFRESFKKVFGWETTRRVQLYPGKDYPENVKVAANWWAKAITAPKLDNGEELPSLVKMLVDETKREYSIDETRTFQNALAENINKQLSEFGRCELCVDYLPCKLLADAGDIIMINGMTGYPWKTDMIITDDVVEVKTGYGQSFQKIWSKEKELDTPIGGKEKR